MYAVLIQTTDPPQRSLENCSHFFNTYVRLYYSIADIPPLTCAMLVTRQAEKNKWEDLRCIYETLREVETLLVDIY